MSTAVTSGGPDAGQPLVGPLAKSDPRSLDASEALTVSVGMPNLLTGANPARHEAYQQLVGRGFRSTIQEVNMHRHNEPGYCWTGVHIIDDWR